MRILSAADGGGRRRRQAGRPERSGQYWTTGRGVEVMDQTYGLLDRTAYGRQEPWEDSPAGWPQITGDYSRTNGRPTAQRPRLEAGGSDDLASGH